MQPIFSSLSPINLKQKLKEKARRIRQTKYKLSCFPSSSPSLHHALDPPSFMTMLSALTRNTKAQIKNHKKQVSSQGKILTKNQSVSTQNHKTKDLQVENNNFKVSPHTFQRNNKRKGSVTQSQQYFWDNNSKYPKNKHKGKYSMGNFQAEKVDFDGNQQQTRKMSFTGDSDKICKGSSLSKFILTLRKKKQLETKKQKLKLKTQQQKRQNLQHKKQHARYEISMMLQVQKILSSRQQIQQQDQPLKQMYQGTHVDNYYNNNRRTSKTDHRFYSWSSHQTKQKINSSPKVTRKSNEQQCELSENNCDKKQKQSKSEMRNATHYERVCNFSGISNPSKKNYLIFFSDKKLKIQNKQTLVKPQNRTENSRLSPWAQTHF